MKETKTTTGRFNLEAFKAKQTQANSALDENYGRGALESITGGILSMCHCPYPTPEPPLPPLVPK